MDLTLGTDRSFSLVTTVVHGRRLRCKLIQAELHLSTADVRIRFSDPDALWHLTSALTELLADVLDPSDYSPVRTRVHTNADPILDRDERALV
jgi:hypothetical protein